jgi:hypothetical protein
MSEEVVYVKPEEVIIGELYDEVPLPPKANTGCLPFAAFTLSDANLKFGFISDTDFVKMGSMFYQGGMMIGKGAYNTACFFGSLMVPV